MRPARSSEYMGLLLSMAALAVLAALFLFPGKAQGQTMNAAPTFNTGLSATTSIEENTATNMDIGSPYTAMDTDTGDTLTYGLDGTDKDSFGVDTSTGQLKTKDALNYESKSSYSVTVTVRDSKDSMGTADTVTDATMAVTINVTNEDEDGTVTITGTLDGGVELTAAVTDMDGEVTSTTWQWARGDTATGTFDNITGATATTYTTVAADVGMFLEATASYTDPQGSGKSAGAVTSSAIAASNAEPAFPSSETGARAVDENTAANTNIGAAVAATDTDSGATLTYALTGTDASSFDIVTTSGQIKTKDALDHENKDSYTVMVTVRDSKDAAGDADTTVDDTIAVTITVTNVNDVPTITTTDITESVNENTATSVVIQTYAATDEDRPAQTLSWNLEGTDSGDFEINSSTGALTFKDVPDYESPADGDAMNDYNITVKVTDNGSPAKSATRAVTITVDDVNDAPTIDSGSAAFPVDENTLTTVVIQPYAASDEDVPAQTLTWSLEGTDAGDFGINLSTGALTFKDVPDYEMPADDGGNNVYNITVRVTDDGSPNMSDTQAVAITVSDVNEPPDITSTGTSHTAPSFAEIAFDATSPDLSVVTYTADDPESNTLAWSVSGTDAASFTIDSTGKLSFSTRPNFEIPADVADSNMMGADDNVYKVVVEVKDSLDDSGNSDTTVDDTINVTVTVTNVDETPEITTDMATHTAPSIAEIEYDIADTDLSATAKDVATYAAVMRKARPSSGPSVETMRATSPSTPAPASCLSSKGQTLKCRLTATQTTPTRSSSRRRTAPLPRTMLLKPGTSPSR